MIWINIILKNRVFFLFWITHPTRWLGALSKREENLPSWDAFSIGITFASDTAIPSTIRLSLVSVPVLSKQQISTFPQKGIRNGSVQNTANLDNCNREVLTARLSSIGNSGGTTDVRIKVHSKKSLYLKLDVENNYFF